MYLLKLPRIFLQVSKDLKMELRNTLIRLLLGGSKQLINLKDILNLLNFPIYFGRLLVQLVNLQLLDSLQQLEQIYFGIDLVLWQREEVVIQGREFLHWHYLEGW